MYRRCRGRSDFCGSNRWWIVGLCRSLRFGGGLASVVGGTISGTVTDWKSAAIAFGIGGFASVIAKGLSDVFLAKKAGKIFNQGRKAKSLAIQKLQTSPFNMGVAAAKGSMRNAFKDISLSAIKIIINNAYSVLRLGIASSLMSAGLSALPFIFM